MCVYVFFFAIIFEIVRTCDNQKCDEKCEAAGAMAGVCNEQAACRCLDLFDDY